MANVNAWKANRFKGNQFTKNTEKDLRIYQEIVLREAARNARDEIYKKYQSLIKDFYDSYDPSYYYPRMGGLKKTAELYHKNVGGGIHVGGIKISAKDMNDDNYSMSENATIKNAGWELKDIIFDVTVIQGEHGRPENFFKDKDGIITRLNLEWFYKPSVYEQIIEFRNDLVRDLNRQIDTYGIIEKARARAKKQHYNTLKLT